MKKFVTLSLLAAVSLWCAAGLDLCARETPHKSDDLKLGVAGYTFRKFNIDQTLEQLRALGIKYLSVKDFWLPLDATVEEMDAFKAKCASYGVNPYILGPIYMSTPEQVEKAFAYAERYGAELFIGVPSYDVLDLVVAKVKETGIKVAVHTHGPDLPDLFPDIRVVVEKLGDPSLGIGCCMDLAHSYRYGEDPARDIQTYAKWIWDIHIKDVTEPSKAGVAKEMGRGGMDIPAIVESLRKIGYQGVVSIEYEGSEDDPLPAVAETAGYLRAVMDAAEEPRKAEPIRMPIAEAFNEVPVGFSLLTHGTDQFVAFYTPDHSMAVGHRKTDSTRWEFVALPSKIGSDSHNSVTMAIDREGRLHVSGNMHASPLVYFRSSRPLDIHSLEQIPHLVGDQEDSVTYPRFMHTRDGDLIFHYRTGGSGNGNEIYDIYSEETRSWSRFLDKPLTDGQGLMNAYMSGPTLIDGWYHLLWVWRDTPDCSTNHDLCYARSRDLKNWENAFGKKVRLPLTPGNRSLLVDPVPARGGIINGCHRVSVGPDGKVLVSYHKFDKDGNTQIYVARPSGKKWEIFQISDWSYRWWFEGGGSINSEIILGRPVFLGDGTFTLSYDHRVEGKGYFVVDAVTLKPLRNVRTGDSSLKIESQDFSVKQDPGFLRDLRAGDLGDIRGIVPGDDEKLRPHEPGRYHLEWQAWPGVRDRQKKDFHPEPGTLYLVDTKPYSAMLENFPAGADPVTIGTRVGNRLLETKHQLYGKRGIHYAEVCTWYGALRFAKATGNDELLDKLRARFDYLMEQEKDLLPPPIHVDQNMFGCLPLRLYALTGQQSYLDMGLMYADTQWTLPEGASAEEKAFQEKDYSWQTRLWIDDMFMITIVQKEAYLRTGDRKYLDRAAREMVMYLDELQRDNGLFYHAPDVPYCWSRGDGWMAVGMADLLELLPEGDGNRAAIMKGYLKMMEGLRANINGDGIWNQVIDEPDFWPESSGSAMFTYAMIRGVKNGWLEEATYAPIVRRAWLSLCNYVNPNGDVDEVCVGTGKRNSRQYYYNRPRVSGDYHGQAPVIWCALALLSSDK